MKWTSPICQTVFRLNSQASESHPLFYSSMLSLLTNAIIQSMNVLLCIMISVL